MFLTSVHLVFWQPIPSFHQEGFFFVLAQADWVQSVTLKYESELSEARRQSGWREAAFSGVKLERIQADEIPSDTAAHIHIFTGFQTHSAVWAAFHRISKNALCRRYAFAEAPECVGWLGVARHLKYWLAARQIASRLDCMLAMGQLGVDFYTKVLPSFVPVYEFAYYDVCAAEIQALHVLDVSDEQATSNKRQPTTAYRFLYVGQLIQRKGVDRLLCSLAQVTVPPGSWTLDVVGDGTERASLEALAERLGIAAHIQWHGGVSSEALSVHYRAADSLVLPSRWDGWGMTVNEALRHGCDALATVTCGAASVLPQANRLPKEATHWSALLEAKIQGGSPDRAVRLANQELARSLSGEYGVARLRAILSA